jgi:hypothetical protein
MRSERSVNPVSKRCPRCQLDLPLEAFVSSPRNPLGVYGYCRVCHAANVRRYAALNRGKVDAGVARWLRSHPANWRAIHNRYNRRLREEVLNAYGHACVCCGVTESEFLCFDHIANDGASRRSAGEPIGPSLYQMLKRNGYPKDCFQLLCHSCNKAKAFYGHCPHQDGVTTARDKEKLTWGRRMRLEVIAGYGGSCACCGVSEQAFLAVDHIHNDGAAERASARMSGAQWYYWLVSRGFPKDRYRLLCHCCNEARAFYGSCPHERSAPLAKLA